MPPSRATLATPRQDNRREGLLDAAALLFAHKGFHATSMRDIAREVGMLPGSMYYHFGSKEELLLAVYGEGVRRIAAHVDAAVERVDDPWRRLEAACTAHLEMLLDRSDFARVLIRARPEEAEGVRAQMVELRESYERRFRALIDELDLPPDADRHYLRLMLIGAMNAVWGWYREGGDPPATIARRFLDMLRRGDDATLEVTS